MAGEDPADFIQLGKACTEPKYVARMAIWNAKKNGREDKALDDLMKELNEADSAQTLHQTAQRPSAPITIK